MASHKVPTLENLQAQAAARTTLREFFDARGYLEVQTPALRFRAAMEPHLAPFQTEWQRPDGRTTPMFLQSSPEYALKMVVAATGASVWELASAYRNEEESRTHRPEFTLLEWYRVGQDYRYLMDETEALVQAIARRHASGWPVVSWEGRDSRLDGPFERLTVQEAFLRHAGLDPLACDTADELAATARSIGCQPGDDWSWEDIFHLILLTQVEPHLGWPVPVFLYEYPARLGALARLKRDDPQVAERCELYVAGLELSNGFSELTDAGEQRRRLVAEQRLRSSLGKTELDIDEDLLAAVSSLPDCTGNALGWERLLMLCLGLSDLSDLLVLP